MKKPIVILFTVLTGIALSALGQGKSPIPKIGQQLTDYYSAYPKEKVFVVTDKSQYRPGETIWFRAFVTEANNFPVQGNDYQLFIKLFDKTGKVVLQDLFRVKQGIANGDLIIPDDLQPDNYFLVAFTQLFHAADRVTCLPIRIDPQYTNQLIAETTLKDSISIGGQRNVLFLTLHEFSGFAKKNTNLRYQFINGDDVLDKGKIKTDNEGKAEIPLMIPEKTNGDPFICELTDMRENWKQDVWLPTTLDPVVLHLYPEGGNLVAGVPAKIAFTAFNKWGVPVDIEGRLVDQDKKDVTMVKTFTRGLGLIALPNNNQQKLKLIISGKTGQNQSFDIPEAAESGLSLSVTKEDTAFVSFNLIFSDGQKHPVSILVTRAGKIYWAGDLAINGSSRLKIPTGNLPEGINLLSVFGTDGKLLADRILYTDRNRFLRVAVNPESKTVKTNKDLKVDVKLTDENGKPVSGRLAISVSDKVRNKIAEPEIEKNMLIGSELVTPFSLISDAFQGQINNNALLEVFLLANKVKDFSWPDVLNFKPGNAPDLRSLNNEIRGVVTDKNGNKVNKAKVSLVNNRNIQLYTTTTNENGQFSFKDLNSSATEDYLVKATDPDGKRELNVSYGRNFEAQLSAYVKRVVQTWQLTRKEEFPQAKYLDDNSFLFGKAPKQNLNQARKLDEQHRMLESATSILDVIKTIKPYKIMNNQIVFTGTENSLNYQGGALIVIDGQQMGTDISIISNLSPQEVDHINVSTNPMDIQRYTGLNSVGVIEIFLKTGKTTETPGALGAKYSSGFRVPDNFDGGKTNTTLQWIPDQQVDSTGHFEFTIRAGKIISDFVIKVQGMTPDGRMGSGEAIISVAK